MTGNIASTTRQIILKSRPDGWVSPENFEMRDAPVPALGKGDVRVRAIYMSLDPYMRGRMDAAKSYAASFQVGAPLTARVVGEVVDSENATFEPGAMVIGMLDWADFSVASGGAGLRRVDPELAPLPHYLGALGMPGMTAWVGLREIGRPRPGETLFVSAASGAVGQIAAQMGKVFGCRVVGSAGSDDKVAFLSDELKLDAAFNYKKEPDLAAALAKHCPDGIDVYFDNVGGPMLAAALEQANPFARFVQCGSISQYNAVGDARYGVRNLTHLTRKRIRMQGFIVSDHADLLGAFLTEMADWLTQGVVVYKVDITDGLENAPQAFIGMLRGENFGKRVVQISAVPEGVQS